MLARRGIALVTALFAVVLLFGFATAMLAQVRGDLALTRDLDQRARARALARSAVQAGLHALNTDPGWEAAHTNQPEQRKLGDHELRFWVEPTDNPGILRLRGESSVGHETARNAMLVTKAGGPGGLLLESGSELFQLNADGGWTLLPPAPERLRNPVGGPQGEVYGWSDHRNLYRFDPGLGMWSLLPRLSAVDGPPEGQERPNLDTGGEEVVADSGPQLSGLAVDSNGQLYAQVKNQVYFLDGTTWRALPPPGGDDLRFLSVDDGGHVWLVRNKKTPVRYDPNLERWQEVASRPETAWEKDKGQLKLTRREKPPEIKGAAADPQGNFYLAGPSRDDIVTLYRFVPERSDGPTLPGTYKVLAAVPKVKMVKQDGQFTGVVLEGQHLKKADNLAVDGSGTLYFRFNRDEFDTLYQAEVAGSRATYRTLPLVPKVKRKNGEQIESPRQFMKDVKRLGGGRIPSLGAPSYVPRYTE